MRTIKGKGVSLNEPAVVRKSAATKTGVFKKARECGKIITVEEHITVGGRGEAISSLLAEKNPVPVKKIGVRDEFGHSNCARKISPPKQNSDKKFFSCKARGIFLQRA